MQKGNRELGGVGVSPNEEIEVFVKIQKNREGVVRVMGVGSGSDWGIIVKI